MTVAGFTAILAPIAAAAWRESEEGREERFAAGVVRGMAASVRSVAVEGRRRLRTRCGPEELEATYRFESRPPSPAKVRFEGFFRDGQREEPSGWWRSFHFGGKDGKEGLPKLFGRMAAMAGWGLPEHRRRLFLETGVWVLDEELLARNYRIRGTGEEEVAGRRSRGWEIEPEFEGRPRYRLWTDVDTGYPLRFRMFQEDGSLLFDAEVEQIRFLDKAPAQSAEREKSASRKAFRILPGLEIRRVAPEEARRQVVFELRAPARLPAGAREDEWTLLRCRTPGHEWEIVYSSFTDGAAVGFWAVSSRGNPFWKEIRDLLSGGDHPEAGEDGDRRIYRLTHPAGTAYFREQGETAIAVAGNFSRAELLNVIQDMRRIP